MGMNECVPLMNFEPQIFGKEFDRFMNVFLSVKVGFFNELENICSELNIDYENVRCIATQDTRIGTGHTKVPGHDGHRGFGGTCFPKDTNALATHAKENGINKIA